MGATITVHGRLAASAEQRQAGNTTVTAFRVASNGSKKDEPPSWFQCSYFGERGAKLTKYLEKGTECIVTGEFKLREYESKGERRTSAEIVVDRFEFAGGKQEGTKANAPANRGDAYEGDDSEPNF